LLISPIVGGTLRHERCDRPEKTVDRYARGGNTLNRFARQGFRPTL
jgi:hypothetical protein